ncbi:MAG: aldo/keto reductase, partial [Verrucomicrobiota bacterium]
ACVNFLDTADVYGAGRSEALIGRFREQYNGDLFIATKVGRTGDLFPDGFTEEGVRARVEDSLKRLGVDVLDLVQLHCIPTRVMEDGAVFDWMRRLKEDGRIKAFGASVESMDEARICMKEEGLSSLQIIMNLFRRKPIETILDDAAKQRIGIIVRLPLASGLLSGKMSAHASFPEDDHRNYNRDGACFNVGETFAGLPFEKGVALAEELKSLVPDGMTMAQLALRWILDFEAVSVVIPGASRPEQARSNAEAAVLPPLSPELHDRLKRFYEDKVAEYIRGPY